MSIFNNKLPGDFSRKKNDRVAAAAMRLWLCSWPRLWHLILGGRGGGEKKLGNITITTTYPSGTLGADCCSPHRLNNPTLNPSPDPAALIGPGLSGSWPLIGGAAEQQAAGWSISPPHRGHTDDGPHGTISKSSGLDSREKCITRPHCSSPQTEPCLPHLKWVWRCTEWKHRFGPVVVRKKSSQIFIQGASITSNYLGWSPLDQINRYSLENNQRTKTEVLEVSISLFTTTRGSSSIARKPQHLSAMQNPSNTCHVPTKLHTSLHFILQFVLFFPGGHCDISLLTQTASP